MLKLSSLSRGTLFRYTKLLQHVSRNVNLYDGKYCRTVTQKTTLLTFQNHVHTCASCLLWKNCNAEKRFLTTDIHYKMEEGKSENNAESKDIESLIEELFEKAMERDRMVATIPKSSAAKHLVKLINAGFQKSDVINLHRNPELIKKLEPLTEMIILLIEYGIPKDKVSHILKMCPDIVHKTKPEVLSMIEKLHEVGFTSDSIALMISNYPALLNSNMEVVPPRIENLKGLFKTKDSLKLLEKSPNLLFCDMKYILERFNYVFLEMGISQPQMLHSKLFSYPMDHIHARHIFLERAGFFKKFKNGKGQLDLNPKLTTIIDTTDSGFVKMFGKMSVKDYHTFKKLLPKDRIMKSFEDYSED